MDFNLPWDQTRDRKARVLLEQNGVFGFTNTDSNFNLEPWCDVLEINADVCCEIYSGSGKNAQFFDHSLTNLSVNIGVQHHHQDSQALHQPWASTT
jgi:hypothetical protein